MNTGVVKGVDKLKEAKPLIHCITSQIAINDCANLLLAIGVSPIMAEHPNEVADITAMSKGLSVSLANITDARAESIGISLKTAKENNIGSVIDVVGITCSHYRMGLCSSYISQWHPSVIKGNVSEILKLADVSIAGAAGALTPAAGHVSGVDVSDADRVSARNVEKLKSVAAIVSRLAAYYKCVVLATGEVDIISNGEETIGLCNGTPSMSRITGTGCMLSCMTASYMSVLEPFDAVMLATSVLNISAEIAENMVRGSNAGRNAFGLGTFKTALHDAVSFIRREDIVERVKLMKL